LPGGPTEDPVSAILDPNTPIVDPITQVLDPVAPVPATPALEPIVEQIAPIVTKEIAPLVEPIVQQIAPIVAPVTEQVAPLVEPIVEQIVPAVEPVVQTVEPAVEQVSSTVAPLTPPTDPPSDPPSGLLAPLDPIVEQIAPAVGQIAPLLQPLTQTVDSAVEQVSSTVAPLTPPTDPPSGPLGPLGTVGEVLAPVSQSVVDTLMAPVETLPGVLPGAPSPALSVPILSAPAAPILPALPALPIVTSLLQNSLVGSVRSETALAKSLLGTPARPSGPSSPGLAPLAPASPAHHTPRIISQSSFALVLWGDPIVTTQIFWLGLPSDFLASLSSLELGARQLLGLIAFPLDAPATRLAPTGTERHDGKQDTAPILPFNGVGPGTVLLLTGILAVLGFILLSAPALLRRRRMPATMWRLLAIVSPIEQPG